MSLPTMFWQEVDPSSTDAKVTVFTDINGHKAYMRAMRPCGHGRIDRHIITDYDGQGVHRDDMKWCPGAAVKGGRE